MPDFASLREPLTLLCRNHLACGTILLAHEGVNGTICAPLEKMPCLMRSIAALLDIGEIEAKTSFADRPPFKRLKVRLKKEIITIGVAKTDPLDRVGIPVAPRDWNTLISNPDVLLLDTRNAYEIELGTFKNAINPQTRSFGELPQFILDRFGSDKARKIAMFCTGGIRCEKASSFMLNSGFDEVYHLKGGILKYLETVQTADSLWQGECFVFDERVAVGHGLVPTKKPEV